MTRISTILSLNSRVFFLHFINSIRWSSILHFSLPLPPTSASHHLHRHCSAVISAIEISPADNTVLFLAHSVSHLASPPIPSSHCLYLLSIAVILSSLSLSLSLFLSLSLSISHSVPLCPSLSLSLSLSLSHSNYFISSSVLFDTSSTLSLGPRRDYFKPNSEIQSSAGNLLKTKTYFHDDDFFMRSPFIK